MTDEPPHGIKYLVVMIWPDVLFWLVIFIFPLATQLFFTSEYPGRGYGLRQGYGHEFIPTLRVHLAFFGYCVIGAFFWSRRQAKSWQKDRKWEEIFLEAVGFFGALNGVIFGYALLRGALS